MPSPAVITDQFVLNTAKDTSLTLTLGNLTATEPDNSYPTGFTLSMLPGTNYTVLGATFTPVPGFFGRAVGQRQGQ